MEYIRNYKRKAKAFNRSLENCREKSRELQRAIKITKRSSKNFRGKEIEPKESNDTCKIMEG